MQARSRFLLISASLLACAASVPAGAQVPATASAHDRLFDLFKRSDEASLKRNPMQAIYRGDLRYADRLGDLYSPEHYAGERAAGERDLAELRTIDRAQLN